MRVSKSSRKRCRPNCCGSFPDPRGPAMMPNRTDPRSMLALTLTAMLFCPAKLPAQGLEYVKAHYTKYEYRIPMRDGKRLFTAVYVPKDSWPKLSDPHDADALTACGPYGVDQYRSDLGPSPLVRQGGLHLRLPGRARPLDVRGRVRQHAAAHPGQERPRRTSTRAATPTTPSTGWSSTSPTTTARSACGASPIRASTRRPG